MKQLLSKIGHFSPWFIVKLYKIVALALLSTCKIEVEGVDHFKNAASKGSCSLVLWHDRLGILAKILYKFAPEFDYLAVLSNSRDGRILGRLATSYKQCGTLFVPHDAREVALRKMVGILKNENKVLIVTPDGPRGPRHKVKPGVVLASIHAESSIIPLTWDCDTCWVLNSWDRMAFPKPFSKIKVNFGEAMAFSTRENLDGAMAKVEGAMQRL
ncbi:MAG: DUF374 domain-containing protein [Parachlamydiales bacterium]|jgi:hypothetical protein